MSVTRQYLHISDCGRKFYIHVVGKFALGGALRAAFPDIRLPLWQWAVGAAASPAPLTLPAITVTVTASPVSLSPSTVTTTLSSTVTITVTTERAPAPSLFSSAIPVNTTSNVATSTSIAAPVIPEALPSASTPQRTSLPQFNSSVFLFCGYVCLLVLLVLAYICYTTPTAPRATFTAIRRYLTRGKAHSRPFLELAPLDKDIARDDHQVEHEEVLVEDAIRPPTLPLVNHEPDNLPRPVSPVPSASSSYGSFPDSCIDSEPEDMGLASSSASSGSWRGAEPGSDDPMPSVSAPSPSQDDVLTPLLPNPAASLAHLFDSSAFLPSPLIPVAIPSPPNPPHELATPAMGTDPDRGLVIHKVSTKEEVGPARLKLDLTYPELGPKLVVVFSPQRAGERDEENELLIGLDSPPARFPFTPLANFEIGMECSGHISGGASDPFAAEVPPSGNKTAAEKGKGKAAFVPASPFLPNLPETPPLVRARERRVAAQIAQHGCNTTGEWELAFVAADNFVGVTRTPMHAERKVARREEAPPKTPVFSPAARRRHAARQAACYGQGAAGELSLAEEYARHPGVRQEGAAE